MHILVRGSTMNICFQAIFNKTIFFHAVAKQLEANGHQIYWTSTSKKWTNWLIANGAAPSDILTLDRPTTTREGAMVSDSDDLIVRIESEYGLSLKKIYFMDRIISSWPWPEARDYMVGVAKELDHFILSKEIDVMFGEATSCDEVISAAVCRLRGKSFYHPGSARIPSDRFLFFKDHLQQEYESFSEVPPAQAALKQSDRIRQAVLSGQKPNYWYWNNKVPSFNAGFVQKLWSKVREALIESRHDALVKSIRYHLTQQRQYLKPFRYLDLKLRPLFEKPVDGERFVLFTLHKQPEASIDVFGADHANQAEIIKQIARHLPADVHLYVKEHSNSIGDRTRKELKALVSLPGVRLIDPYYDVHELIRKSEAVVTISGTVAYEAALYGKPTGTFSKMYFSGFSSIRHLKGYADVVLLLHDTGGWTNGDREHLAKIVANSFEGVIGDPQSTPVCMIDENISRIASGIEALCEKLACANSGEQRMKPTVTIVCDSHGAGYGTTGFTELVSKRLTLDWRVSSHAFGGLSVKDILQKLRDRTPPISDMAIIQVGNPDVHPRMPIRPLRFLRSLGLSFCRDSLFSIPPKRSLRYFLRFPFFLLRLLVIRFHQEFLVSTDELKTDLDELIAHVSRRSRRVMIMPVFAVHPKIYTPAHKRRAEEINEYLAVRYPEAFVAPRVLRQSTYTRYYNRDGFHFIRRYHEQVAQWLVNRITDSRRDRKELVLRRPVPESVATHLQRTGERQTVA